MTGKKTHSLLMLWALLIVAATAYMYLTPSPQPTEELYAGAPLESPTLSLKEGPLKNQNFKIANTNSREYITFIKRMDSFYNEQRRRGWNGAVMVAYRGQPLYNRYFGYADYGKKTMINDETSFQLASTSKPFTAVSILMLQEQGKLNIYDDVRKHIPNFPYRGITIKNLLTHTSGMQDYIHWANSYWSTDRDGYMSNDDLLELMAEKKPKMIFTPNTRFKYTNTNYAVLASIVEKVSGKPFAEFLKMNIFIPLRMYNTYVVDPREPMPAKASLNYKGGWNEYKFMYQDGLYGDKGVFSTVKDMLKFDQALYTTALLSRNSIFAAYSPQNKMMKSPKNYGLGWRMYIYPDREKIIYHNGLWHGNNSCYYRFIQDRFTIIVQCNKFTTRTYDQPSAICDIVADIEGIDNSLDK